jgi:hypothetical protein
VLALKSCNEDGRIKVLDRTNSLFQTRRGNDVMETMKSLGMYGRRDGERTSW